MIMVLLFFIIIIVKISIKDLYSCLNSLINFWYKMIYWGYLWFIKMYNKLFFIKINF